MRGDIDFGNDQKVVAAFSSDMNRALATVPTGDQNIEKLIAVDDSMTRLDIICC